METHILQSVIDLIQSAFLPMLGRVRPTLLLLATFLLFLEGTKLATRWTLCEAQVLWEGLTFLLKTSIILFLLLTSYGSVVNMIYRSAIILGLKAGGDVLTIKEFLDPGQYIHLGLAASAPLWEKIRLSTLLATEPTGFGYLLAWAFCLGAYIAMAFTIFIAQVEMTVAVICCAVMLPFMLFSSTAWMGQGTLAYPINKAFRFFVLAVLACALFPIIKNELTLVPEPTRTLWEILTTFKNRPTDDWQRAIVLVIATWAIALVYLKTSSLASGILSGRPVLTGSAVLHAATTTAMAVGSIGAGATTGLLIGAGGPGGVIGTQAPQVLYAPTGFGQQPTGSRGPQRAQALSAMTGGLSRGLITGARYLSHD